MVGLLLAGTSAFACSSKSAGLTPAGSVDGGSSQPGTDAGHADGGGFAAYAPDIGQIIKGSGPMLATPKLVTVTWNADPNQAALEDFGDKLGASSYWKTTVGEYGIGPLTSGPANHVRIAAAPPATSDSDAISTLVSQGITTPGSGWPAADAGTIYVVYVPTATKLASSTVSHSELQVPGNDHVPYVIIDEGANVSAPVLDAATANAGHEIAETATNPHVLSDTALVGFDGAHVAWQMFVSDAEIGDICELYQDVAFRPADLAFTVQRLWSNKAAAAGLNPCVPAPPDPYYNVTPLALENVSVFVDTASSPSNGLGYRINIGSKKTIKLGFFSDKPVAAPWTITAVEGNWFSPASNHRIAISVDKGTGNNGDVGEITVTATTQNMGAGNAVLMTVTSQAAGLPPHTVPILIGTY